MRPILESVLPKRQVYMISGLLFAAGLPHIVNLTWAVLAFFVAMIVLRLYIQIRQWQIPNSWIKIILMVFAFWLVYQQYHTFIGLEGGSSLLMVMLGLKLLETRKRRDIYITVFLIYFLIAIQYLFNQSIGLVIYLTLIVIMSTGLLVDINQVHASKNVFKPIKYAAIMLLQAIPLMIVLFVLFPRMSSPLWDIGLNNRSAKTGLGGTMQPGSMSQLVQSHEVAFRVKFYDAIPTPSQRYWRGPVLWHFDGKKWEAAKTQYLPRVKYQAWSDAINYQVSLEPTGKTWLMALDLPGSLPSNSYITGDYQLKSRDVVEQLLHYDMASYLDYIADEITPFQTEMALNLPDNVTQRMRDLVAKWTLNNASPEQIVRSALAYYNQELFVYTLKPPLLGNSPTDEFLFETRRGFCEHYASSFAQLMRIAGIPSRVVTGYLGGEYNEIDHYFIIRQSDAHAWTEVWYEDKGWTRVDPTAAVAPERVEHGIDLGLLGLNDAISFDMGDAPLLKAFVHRLSLYADAMNNRWNQYVLQYSDEKQAALLKYLGLDFLKEAGMTLLAVMVVLSLMILLALFLFFQGKRRLDPSYSQYIRFCKKLSRQGVMIKSTEGPKDLSQRIETEYPLLANKARLVFRLYIQMRYEKNPSKQSLKLLKQAISNI